MSVSSKGSVAISVSPGSAGTGSDELTLTTNCSSGYVVYASATSSSASTSLSNDSGSEISASSNTLASPGTLSDNTWGIANAENYTNGKFAGLPTYANMATTSLTSGNSAVSATKIPVYYGVKVNSSITPGTYTGNVLYTAMVNSACYTYTITYDANGGSGTMNDQELPMNTETALTSNTFTRDGYSFLGWSEDKDAKTATFTDAQSVTGETFGLTENGANLTLYAIWEEDVVVEMQNWLGCGKLADNEIVTLLDTRNNVKYKVKKVVAVEGSTTPDYAQCWMVENLRLTPGDSDPGTTTAYKNNETLTLTTDTSQGSGTITFKTDLGSSDTTIYARYDGNANSIKYGAYYQWEAARLVCPAGWHLPTGRSGGEFYNLDVALGGTGTNRSSANTYNLFTNPIDDATTPGLGFTLAGLYSNSSPNNNGTYGHYWASTIYSSSYGHFLDLNSNTFAVSPQSYDGKRAGLSVRCVADQTAEIDGIMQNWIGCDSLADNEIVSLLDTRNNVIYKVKKIINDSTNYSECWMAENLRYMGSTGTDPGTTSITSGSAFTTDVNSQISGTSISPVSYFATSGDATIQARYDGNTTYGAYYSWTAAKSVCPAGWHLPTGGPNGDFYDLDRALGGTGGDRTNANTYSTFTGTDLESGQNMAFPLAGYYNGGSLNGGSSSGNYWTSTVKSSNGQGQLLNLNSSYLSVYPQGNDGKYRGFSVRCVAGGDPTTMQGFNASKQLPNVGDKATLTDVRDGSTYTVERLADGKVWMTQNLRIVNKTLTPADTNLAPGTTFTLEASNASYFTDSTSTSYTERASTYYNNNTTYGAYYNYYAATAGYSWYKGGGTGISDYDICPKGWRLPIGGTDKTTNDFSLLDIAVNGSSAGDSRTDATSLASLTQSASSKTDGWPGFTLAGYMNSGSLKNAGADGGYWSSTAGGATYGYHLVFYSSGNNVYPKSYSGKYIGFSVRCIARAS